ncbi:LolA family protein [Microlunatus flavus]|nr:outer membrane lipoprotein carrier protein LolA [Microlunatus flavus]
MRTFTARPALRWLVPLAVLLVVLATFLATTRASAKAPLPEISAQDLLVKVADAKVDGLSGTVVQNADLGIPAIPGGSDSAGGKLTSLLSGSHSMRVWYGAPDQARVAVNDEYAETDVIADGSTVWTYDSRAKKATKTTLPADAKADESQRKAPAGAPQTPQDAAKEILAKITPTTDVRVDPEVSVAGRAAYDLVLTPRDSASLVKQVRVAVDGENYTPLRVQVFGPDDKVALDVSYTDITFGQPDARMFAFNPPEGTKVTQKAAPERKEPTAAQKKELQSRKAQADRDTTTVGEGWSTVVITKLPSDATGSSNATLKGFLGQLKPVSGSWGTGRELDGTIVTAILTDDGRLAVGAVGADVVSQALAR